MRTLQSSFSSIWFVICGVLLRPGESLTPVYVAAATAEKPNQCWQVALPELLDCANPPYPTGPDCLLVTISANELVGCHLALGWPLPERILDLTIEFRNAINGRRPPCGVDLVGALVWHGLPAADGLDRSTSPVAVSRRLTAVYRLFQATQSNSNLEHALLRGRYMVAVARMERVGVPIDHQTAKLLATSWPRLRAKIAEQIDLPFQVYKSGQFQLLEFESWLARRGIDWPRAALGAFDLSNDTFREMARLHPELRPLRELRSTLTGFDPSALTLGRDGRNRTPIRPFASRTGRNQPSSNASVLDSAAWFRNVVQPAPGMALALIDWTQQEFGIAAALSNDAAMLAAYATGDPYLAFAVRCGAAPHGATSVTHGDIREQFKVCALGVLYGIGPVTLARLAKVSEAKARQLIRWHRSEFASFWRWSDAIEAHGLLHRQLESVFGWRITIGNDVNPRFLRNFPMQANGAEMLRLACCLITESGIQVCFPQHDALLIEASLDEIDSAIAVAERLMAEASRVVLDGVALRTKARIVRYPDRLGDARGRSVWAAIELSLSKPTEREQHVQLRNTTGASTITRPIYLCGSKEDSPNASD